VDLWPWAHFSLGFLTSFGRLFRLRCFALSSLYKGKIGIQKKSLKSSSIGKITTPGAKNTRMEQERAWAACGFSELHGKWRKSKKKFKMPFKPGQGLNACFVLQMGMTMK